MVFHALTFARSQGKCLNTKLLGSRPDFERAKQSMEINRKSKKFAPFVEMADKHEGLPTH